MIAPKLDHSLHFGPARHQGLRLTCLAFAMSDLNRHAANAPDFLSPEFLYLSAGAAIPGWTPGEGLYLDQTLLVAAKPGQPLEVDFPYRVHVPAVAATPVTPPGATMYRSQLQRLQPTSDEVAEGIRRGHAVGLIVACTDTLFKPVDGIVHFTHMVVPDAFHAVLAVGIGTDAAGDEHILIRNSWGLKWGQQGHAWLTREYINVHALEAFGR